MSWDTTLRCRRRRGGWQDSESDTNASIRRATAAATTLFDPGRATIGRLARGTLYRSSSAYGEVQGLGIHLACVSM